MRLNPTMLDQHCSYHRSYHHNYTFTPKPLLSYLLCVAAQFSARHGASSQLEPVCHTPCSEQLLSFDGVGIMIHCRVPEPGNCIPYFLSDCRLILRYRQQMAPTPLHYVRSSASGSPVGAAAAPPTQLVTPITAPPLMSHTLPVLTGVSPLSSMASGSTAIIPTI